jgi:hypothetical protein
MSARRPAKAISDKALTHPGMGDLGDRLEALLAAYLAEGCDAARPMTAAAWQGVSAALEAAVHCIGDLGFVQLTLNAWSNGTGVPRITGTAEPSPTMAARPLP